MDSLKLLCLTFWMLFLADTTESGRKKPLHAPANPPDNLSNEERNCWEIYTVMLQMYEGVEVAMPPAYRYNYMIDGDSLSPSYCAMVDKLEQMMRKRKKRFYVNFEELDETRLWDKDTDFPIRYKFGPGYGVNGDRENVRRAISMVERVTCVPFREISANSLYQRPHIEFRRSQACVSFVGRSIDTVPQPIYLTAACLFQWGDIAHEILHTLGLWHTHQRSSRSQSVIFRPENVQPEYAGQFVELPEVFGITLGRDYDYASIMHFNGKQFAEGDVLVLETINPLFQRTIGQRVELSFDDALYINHIYCSHVCAPFTLNCKNGGYIDPKDCSQCRCPDGFTGRLCDEISPHVVDNCGVQELTATFSTAYITTPDYPVAWYKIWQECTWKITAPNAQVEFWFVDEFGIFCKFDDVCFHWVEVRYHDALNVTGPRFCCTDLPYGPIEGNTFVSDSEDIMVLFRARWNETNIDGSYRLGFKMAYRAVLPEICVGVECSGNGACNPVDGSCICNPGYEGIDCEEEINECEGVICENGGSCEDELNGFTCRCVDGYNGTYCEEEINECEDITCENGGTCIDEINGFRCRCVAGYEGTTCDEDTNECRDEPCLNGGICVNSVGSYGCECPDGFFGRNCEQDINECASRPCLNGATCIDQANMYQCICAPNYEGVNCERFVTTPRTTERPRTTRGPIATTIPTMPTTTRPTPPTIRPDECQPDRWGDFCQYPKSCGGHHPYAGPGILDFPCNHVLCSYTTSYKTCTRKWFVRKCKYKTRRHYYSCENPQPVCDSSIGFELVEYDNIYWCAQAGYQLRSCDCCRHHCGDCEGWHRYLFYWTLYREGDQWIYDLHNRTCIRYPNSHCRN